MSEWFKERKKVFQSQGEAEIGSRLGKGSKQLDSEKVQEKQVNKISTSFLTVSPAAELSLTVTYR